LPEKNSSTSGSIFLPAGDRAAFSLMGGQSRVDFRQPPTPFLADDMLRVRKVEQRLPDDLARFLKMFN